jgi:FMN phosphatase YigB (HAD superfamily)
VLSVAAETGGAFKPHRATYAKAAEALGVRREEVLFVAEHAWMHARQATSSASDRRRLSAGP